MKYYDIEFGYYPGPYCGNPGPDRLSHDASAANIAADELVEQAAEANGIEMMHAYSWPDGSLYKYIRTDKALTLDDLKRIFTITAELERPDPDDAKVKEKITMRVSPSIREMPLVKAQCIQGGSAFFVTLEERFELARKHGEDHKAHNAALTAIHNAREDELKAIPDYTAYDRARDACAICKPGQMACHDCSKLHSISWRVRGEFLDQHRPMNPPLVNA